MNFAAVYSSDLRRAAETAQAIADRCQCSKVSSCLPWNAVILIQALGIWLKGLGWQVKMNQRRWELAQINVVCRLQWTMTQLVYFDTGWGQRSSEREEFGLFARPYKSWGTHARAQSLQGLCVFGWNPWHPSMTTLPHGFFYCIESFVARGCADEYCLILEYVQMHVWVDHGSTSYD
jgi:hypothetical protein